MYVTFQQLIRELQRSTSVQAFQIPPELVITRIEILPVAFDPYQDAGKQGTLYLCEYWQLKRFDPHAQLPPLICVVESNAGTSPALFLNRCIAAVYGSTLMEVLLALTNSAYDLGCKSSLVTEISRTFLQCTSPEQLVKEGFRALKNPLIVTDFDQKVLFSIDPDLVSNPIYRNILASEYLPVGHPTPSTTTSWNAMDVPFVLDHGIEGLFPIICKPLSVGTVTLGYLHILQLMHPFEEQDTNIAELLGNLLAVELWQRRRNETHLRAGRLERFFRDILDNLLGDEMALAERQHALGITLKPHLYAMVFNISQAEEADSVHRILFTDLVALVSNHLNGSHPFLYKNSVFAVVESETEIDNFHAYLKPIWSELEQYHLIVGVSNEMPSIAKLREAGYQCRKALQLGSALRPQNYLYPYQDYILYYMMELCLKDEDLMALCPAGLRKLMVYCKANGPELLDTLKVYLNCGRNKSTTAKEIYVHVNTVKYRISQIQEITNLDLGNDTIALELMLAFKMFEYREKFSSYEPIINQ